MIHRFVVSVQSFGITTTSVCVSECWMRWWGILFQRTKRKMRVVLSYRYYEWRIRSPRRTGIGTRVWMFEKWVKKTRFRRTWIHIVVVVVWSKTYDDENEALMLGRMKLRSKVSSLCFGIVVSAFIFGNTSIVVTGQLFVSFAPMRWRIPEYRTSCAS